MNGDLQGAKRRMEGALDSLRQAFAKIRTGRANPALLDSVEVDYYGTPTPISHAATIVVEGARSLVITPWDAGMLQAIEKALLASNLGLTPNVQGEAIRINLPQLTEETRSEYVRQAKDEAEKARIAVRNIRRDVNNSIKQGSGEQDASRRMQNQVQKLTDEYIENIDKMLKGKEEDLSEF
ncbi:MAG: ribosome recycling factor [Gammaproteobacteria bacterium AqS3]|nr:ribosome recycling factor [Gammaproteobacteria bacterium AqS3]